MTEKDTVELIVSGYEWVCPSCKELKKEIEITEEVFCKDCLTWFIVDDYYHAHG